MTNRRNFFTLLAAAAERNHSLLCVGLDPNPTQIPARFRRENADDASAILAWHREIIAQTQDLVCCYKPNIAFFEALGAAGMALLRQTLALIPEDIPVLLDAKRGDIGSTAEAYARACFDDLGVDAVTLSPYLGRESVEPFARYPARVCSCSATPRTRVRANFRSLRSPTGAVWTGRPTSRSTSTWRARRQRWSPQVGLVVGATYPAGRGRRAPRGAGRLVPDPGCGQPGRRSGRHRARRSAPRWQRHHRQRESRGGAGGRSPRGGAEDPR